MYTLFIFYLLHIRSLPAVPLSIFHNKVFEIWLGTPHNSAVVIVRVGALFAAPPSETSQFETIKNEWKRKALQCVWRWAARGRQRGSLTPQAQVDGKSLMQWRKWTTVQRLVPCRLRKKGTDALCVEGEWRVGSRILMKGWDYFPKWHGLGFLQMRILQRWHSTWEHGIPPGTELSHDLNAKRKGILFISEFSVVVLFFYLTSLGCEWTQSEIWIWAKHFCFSSSATVWQWFCRYPLAPLWTLTTSRRREWRRSGDRSSVNSGSPARLKQQVRVKYRFRFWPFITAPRSWLRSWEGTDSKVVDRITRRLSTMPKRFTSSTW